MVLFALTHVDTFLVLVAFCGDEDYATREVLLGHYLGFMVGLALAVVGGILAAELLSESAFLLGFVPLALGLWGLARQREAKAAIERVSPPTPGRRVSVVTSAGVGLSGENVAVFVPFFAGLSTTELGVSVVAYFLAAGVLFGMAWVAVRTVWPATIPPAIENRLVPGTLVVVGIYVLLAGWFVA